MARMGKAEGDGCRKVEVTASGKEETPTLAGTARYGPVRRVVWDPWLA
jgi:hypothetical protein